MELIQISKLINEHQTELTRKAVKSLTVFGSVARGEAGKDSDIDMLVEFSQPIGLVEFIRLKRYLEQLTSTRVDLVTVDALRAEMKETILSEAVQVG